MPKNKRSLVISEEDDEDDEDEEELEEAVAEIFQDEEKKILSSITYSTRSFTPEFFR